MMHTPPPDDAYSKSSSPSLSRHAVPPTKPRPSEDKGILPPPQAASSAVDAILSDPDAIPSDPNAIDISTLSPLAALQLLAATVDSLMHQHTCGPPTPPHSSPTTPRTHTDSRSSSPSPPSPSTASPTAHHHHDVPRPHKTPIGSPEAHPADAHDHHHSPPENNFRIDDAEEESLKVQYRLLARKFASKVPPPIPLGEYLRRLQMYCPMSTAVFLAAGGYVLRLAGRGVDSRGERRSSGEQRDGEGDSEREGERHGSRGEEASRREHGERHHTLLTIAVEPKTAHRLVLAALRVAAKALEDRTFPHARVAKVGGVSERELARLEISCAFLLDFELLVGREEMQDVARRMVRMRGGDDSGR